MSTDLPLEFPCHWTYTLFGADEAKLRGAVASTVGKLDHTLELSHESKAGRYRSMQLRVLVPDDGRRLSLFQALSEHPDVLYVL